jgi:glycosyltransferase involved in cell wall biosynthesis
MQTDPRSSAVLVIPAWNEETSLPLTLSRVPAGLFAEVVVADNGSTDRTAEVARRAGARVVTAPERGYGAACLAALATLPPGTGTVVFLQADASEDPAEAPLLLEPIEAGLADLVIGSRTLGRAEEGSLEPHQRFGNALATWLLRLLYGHSYTDLGPFRAIRLEALNRLQMRERRYGWTIEMQVKALEQGLRVLEVPVTYSRRVGVSKVSGNLRASVHAGFTILFTLFRSYARYRIRKRSVR